MTTRKALKTEYLIIGNSAGGVGAAEAIREVDKKNSITIVSDEPYPAYSRPLISEYLSCERTPEEMLFRPADFYERNNIELMLGKAVKSLDLTGKVVELDSV
jgi:NAD(P)H-nitrite reductase large subunit